MGRQPALRGSGIASGQFYGEALGLVFLVFFKMAGEVCFTLLSKFMFFQVVKQVCRSWGGVQEEEVPDLLKCKQSGLRLSDGVTPVTQFQAATPHAFSLNKIGI